jgi:glycosyltransferase involved in cell wall biosynthesis
MLQGEDTFLDALPPDCRERAWDLIAERAADVDLFLAPTRYFADLMGRRLRLRPERIRVVPNGINLEGYRIGDAPTRPPVVGYFARMCPEKGLETLVDAYIQLRRRNRVGRVCLKIGGGCGPADARFVAGLRERLTRVGWARDAAFHPNLDRAQKIEFLRSLTVFSVPALFGEAFGLYLIEAMAAGVPVVQPDVASFPELLAATGGGLLCEPNNSEALAAALESLLLDPPRARALGQAGRRAVLDQFTSQHMAAQVAAAYEEAVRLRSHSGPN